MNTTVSAWLRNPVKRRQLVMILSGGLILLAFGAGQVLGSGAAQQALLAVAALVAGQDIALRAWRALRHRQISIELLVTIAAGGALLIGEVWEAAAVTFLFIFGAYLEARTLTKTRQTLQSLLKLAPTVAIVERGGRQVEVQPQQVSHGEIVLVKPGAKVPVDGVVVAGRSAVDESAITGESLPVEKAPGETVYASTVNQHGLLKVRATGVGADTTLARIIRRVEEAQEEKAPTQKFIERFARWYTPAIIGLSAIAYLLSRDIELALTLLVIGCPGALVISTPVSVVAGIGRAAKSGILIKGGEYLENAGKISALAIDKTGTLTQGKPRVTDLIALQPALAGVAAPPWSASAQPYGKPDAELSAGQALLYWAGIAEAGSEHPLARPILAEAEKLGPLPAAEDFETMPGRGVQAVHDGHTITVGAPAWLAEKGVALPEGLSPRLAELHAQGKTAVVVGLDGLVIGVIGIADALRPGAPQVVGELKKAGVKRVIMLTGDNQRTAQAIAAQAGIQEVHAGLLPDDKLRLVKSLQAEGHVVAMTGDGINDAPALAAADIGLAMGAAGTDVAIETADIALMADNLAKIPEAIRLSRATLGNIRQNVTIALVTVAGLLAGVVLGEVHMAGGMLIHEASVLIVILNAMRLLRI